MAVRVNHVVEVARTTALRECPQLLSHELGQGVAEHVSQVARSMTRRVNIAERMDHGPKLEWEHDHFVCGQVELDLGSGRDSQRSYVTDPGLDRGLTALVPPCPEGSLIDLQLESALFTEPRGDVGERARQRDRVEIVETDGEVEILREPVRLEPALRRHVPPLNTHRWVARLFAMPARSHPST